MGRGSRLGRRRILLRGWVIHGVITVVRRVRTSRTVWSIWTIGGTLVVGEGVALLAAVIVICAVGMIRWTTVLRITIVWATKDLIRQSNILHAWRSVWRLRIRRESLAFVRRERVRGGMLRGVCPPRRQNTLGRENAWRILLLWLLRLLRHDRRDPRHCSQSSQVSF